MSKDPAGYALASQIVRSGTSVGANIEEAQGAISKKRIYSQHANSVEGSTRDFLLD